MKFYDKKGRQHKSIFTAYLSDIKDVIKDHIPMLKENETNDEEPVFEEIGYDLDEAPDVNLEVAPDGITVDVPTGDFLGVPYSKVRINYAQAKLELLDENGLVVTTSDIDPKLCECSIDKILMEVLYNGNPPEGVVTNIQSAGQEVSPCADKEQSSLNPSSEPWIRYRCSCGQCMAHDLNPDEICPNCDTSVDIPVNDPSFPDATDGAMG